MQTLGSSSRRALIASALAVALVGGGVAASQFVAGAATPAAPAPTASASGTPSASSAPTATSSAPSAEGSAAVSPSASASSTPTPSATPSMDFCKVTDEQIKEARPKAQAKDEFGRRNWYEGLKVVGSTQDGVGWMEPCYVN